MSYERCKLRPYPDSPNKCNRAKGHPGEHVDSKVGRLAWPNEDAPVHDYTGVVSLMAVNWDADDDAFRYLLDGAMDRLLESLEAEGVKMDAANIRALYGAAWAHRDQHNERQSA